MKRKIFDVLQRIGRSFMLPIAILPIAGLFLGIGSSLTNANMIQAYQLDWILGKGTFLYAVFKVMSSAGNIVFTNLPIIFAMGVAIGMAKKEKEVAALSSAISFFIMHAVIGAMLEASGAGSSLPQGSITFVVGITSLQMGVFGGVLVGLGVAGLHNRFYKTRLPQALSFFGGTRFVPIICAIVYVFVGVAMFFIWPFIQQGIYMVGEVVRDSGYFGSFLYGLLERALIPFGLHHVFYLPFWQTGVGGTMVIAGQTVEGAQNIFFAQLADPNTLKFSVEATRFMSGKFPLMIFGLPGAALAMYRCADPRKRKVIGGLLFSAALTSMLTGITEPLEFTFLFVAPLLYVIHCIFAGLAFMLMHILQVGVGLTFSGGLIDLFLFGVFQGNEKTNWILIVVVGIVYFIVYYLLFTFLIRKLNLKTPGREDDKGEDEIKLYNRVDAGFQYILPEERQKKEKKKELSKPSSKASREQTAIIICEGLGGKENIIDVSCCATRLHVNLHDVELVSDALLKAGGAAGIIKKGKGIQIIYGPLVTVIKSDLEDVLTSGDGKRRR